MDDFDEDAHDEVEGAEGSTPYGPSTTTPSGSTSTARDTSTPRGLSHDDEKGGRERDEATELWENDYDVVPEYDVEMDIFEEMFKMLGKTTDEVVLLSRLHILDIPEPETDSRVPGMVNKKKGLFYQLMRILKKWPRSEDVVEKTMSLLKKYGSLEEHVIRAVENDVVRRVIGVLTLHIKNKNIVGDGVILLGNLSLNEYIKELIRMEDGVKVLALVMKHPEHASDPLILDKCCYCLANLAVDNTENIKAVVSSGALKSVLEGMERFRDHSELLDSSTVVLSNLCAGGEKQRKEIAEAGTVATLVNIISYEKAHDEKHDQVLKDCLRAIGNLSLHKETLPLIIDGGAVDCLVGVIERYAKNIGVVTLAISVLGNLAAFCTPSQVKKLVDKKAINIIMDASNWHPESVKIQTAFFGAIANFSKNMSDDHDGMERTLMRSLDTVLTRIRGLEEHEEIVMAGLKLLMRMAQQDERKRMVARPEVCSYLTDLIERSVKAGSFKITRQALLCSAALSNEVTAPNLCTVRFVKVINNLLVDLVDDCETIEAALRVMQSFSLHQSTSSLIAEITSNALVRTAARHRNKPSFVLKLTGLIGSLAIFSGTMIHIRSAGAGMVLFELLSEYGRSAGVATKLLIALTNMMMSEKSFAIDLSRRGARRVVEPMLLQHQHEVHLRNAAQAFLSRLEGSDTDLPDLSYDALDPSAQHLFLKQKFNVPTIDQEHLNFLTHGQQMRYFPAGGRPEVMHVFSTEKCRFLAVRDLTQKNVRKEFALRLVTDIVSGTVTKELQDKYMFKRSAVPAHSFAILGENFAISLEANSQGDRDKWVYVLRETVRWRKSIMERRKELSEEEKNNYF